MKYKTGFLVLAVIFSLSWIAYSYGLLAPYNYFTAKRDIKNGKINLLMWGEVIPMSTQNDLDSLSKTFGFTYYRVTGCNLNSFQLNGFEKYNETVEEYLDSLHGKNWKQEFILLTEKRKEQKKLIVNELETDTVTIILEYFGWLCPCPQWISSDNKKTYLKLINNDSIKYTSLFWNIKPANDSIQSPFDLIDDDFSNLKFKFTGRFFKKEQWLGDEGEMAPAKTLSYETVELLIKPTI